MGLKKIAQKIEQFEKSAVRKIGVQLHSSRNCSDFGIHMQ